MNGTQKKNEMNKEKHGISFETAVHVFDDKYCVEIYDQAHSIDEGRYIAVGQVGKILFVVFNSIRIISARLATEKERRIYYDSNLFC